MRKNDFSPFIDFFNFGYRLPNTKYGYWVKEHTMYTPMHDLSWNGSMSAIAVEQCSYKSNDTWERRWIERFRWSLRRNGSPTVDYLLHWTHRIRSERRVSCSFLKGHQQTCTTATVLTILFDQRSSMIRVISILNGYTIPPRVHIDLLSSSQTSRCLWLSMHSCM